MVKIKNTAYFVKVELVSDKRLESIRLQHRAGGPSILIYSEPCCTEDGVDSQDIDRTYSYEYYGK
jgi:hypothetical protein